MIMHCSPKMLVVNISQQALEERWSLPCLTAQSISSVNPSRKKDAHTSDFTGKSVFQGSTPPVTFPVAFD